MTAIGSTNHGFGTFVYNDQYFGHALVKPTLRCWEIITRIPVDNYNCLTDVVNRSLAGVALMFSSTLFVPGLILKSISYLLSPSVQAVPVNTQDTDQLTEFARLAGENRPLVAELQNLRKLHTFAAEPRLDNYMAMPIPLRSLVAIHYEDVRFVSPTRLPTTYSVGYSLERLQSHLEYGPLNRSVLDLAVNQAARSQKRVFLANVLLKTLREGGDIEPLANDYPDFFEEIKCCLWKAHGSPQNRGNDFGGDILRREPRSNITTRTIERAIHVWSLGSNLDLYDFERGRWWV